MSGAKVRVWDLPTRLFHWLLVVGVAATWATGELGKLELHFLLGYAVLGLLAFRLLWGFVGAPTARFAQFVKGPQAAIGYLRYRLGRADGVEPPLGHNPLGGWMVVALLLVLLIQATTGLFATDDVATDGPLVSYVSSKTAALLSTIHRVEAKLLLALVLIHVGAVYAYLKLFGENLVRPMITGWKATENK
ncbi:MAG TPA: cytochrome b/b6 domain-containing protein [Azospirillaceae bacterium]|nr:cytochrome b/b6 domain-containing protein [Azospirillaceae bacterium]